MKKMTDRPWLDRNFDATRSDTSENGKVEYDIPISLKMIQGAIPNYYFNGIESKSIVVPTK